MNFQKLIAKNLSMFEECFLLSAVHYIFAEKQKKDATSKAKSIKLKNELKKIVIPFMILL